MQIAYFMVILLACALTILAVKFIMTEFNKGVNELGYNSTAVQKAQDNIAISWEMTDYAMMELTIFLFIILIVSCFLIPTHPIFLVVNFFGVFFLIFIGMITSNLYAQIVAGPDAVFATEAATFTITNFIMSYLPFIVAGIIFVTSIVMYMRGSAPQ